jgi:hypothetical protein
MNMYSAVNVHVPCANSYSCSCSNTHVLADVRVHEHVHTCNLEDKVTVHVSPTEIGALMKRLRSERPSNVSTPNKRSPTQCPRIHHVTCNILTPDETSRDFTSTLPQRWT